MEQNRPDTCAVVWIARAIGHVGVSACPLLKKCRHQGGCEAEYEAYQPHCVDPDDGCTERRWYIPCDGIGAVFQTSYCQIGTGGQLFVEFNDKGANSCREKTCLESRH